MNNLKNYKIQKAFNMLDWEENEMLNMWMGNEGEKHFSLAL